VLGTLTYFEHIVEVIVNTVKPQLSGFLDYPDFFSSPNFVMNIYKS